MALTKTSYSLNSYTINTWTDFISGSPAGDTVATIIIANQSVSSISMSMRITNSSNTNLATIIPSVTVNSGTSQAVQVGSINLISQQKIQIYADTVGLHFFGSGVSY